MIDYSLLMVNAERIVLDRLQQLHLMENEFTERVEGITGELKENILLKNRKQMFAEEDREHPSKESCIPFLIIVS